MEVLHKFDRLNMTTSLQISSQKEVALQISLFR